MDREAYMVYYRDKDFGLNKQDRYFFTFKEAEHYLDRWGKNDSFIKKGTIIFDEGYPSSTEICSKCGGILDLNSENLSVMRSIEHGYASNYYTCKKCQSPQSFEFHFVFKPDEIKQNKWTWQYGKNGPPKNPKKYWIKVIVFAIIGVLCIILGIIYGK
ncbi:MAG: hypothetical protein LBM99_04315 [Bacillales bacterium]|nr:hypothetical protein [Bacillales bacterium]